MRQRPHLVLLHGWGMEGRVFSPWLPMLEEDFHVHSWELPGHGKRPCPAAGWQWEAELDALHERLAAVPAAPILLGWSLGGLLALALALRGDLRLTGLVLVATSPCFVARPDWTAGIAAQILDDFARELTRDAQGLRRRFFALQTLGDPAARARMPQIDDWPLPDRDCLQAGLGFLRDIDLRPSLHALPYPVLLLQGDADRIVLPAAADALQQALPGSILRLLHCGHAPFLSQPAACSQALHEVFLA